MGVVVEEMLQLKYGVALDSHDFVRKVASHCRGSSAEDQSSVEAGAMLDPAELVERLNAWRDLRFRSRDGISLLALRLEARSLADFEELQREVKSLLGTSRAVAIVDLDAEVSPRRRTRAQALAVFRQDYAQPHQLVGRALTLGSVPLVSFGRESFRSAVLLDPQLLAVTARGRTGDDATAEQATQPGLREEYASTVGSYVPAGESVRRSPLPSEVSSPLERATWREVPAGTEASPIAQTPWKESAGVVEAGSAAKAAWREVPLSTEATETGGDSSPAPAQRWMRRLRRSLEHPDVGGEQQLALLQQLNLWLDGSPDMAAAARRALVDAGLHASLVEVVRRASAAGGRGRAELLVASQACRAIGLGSKDFPEGAVAFARALAAPALCGLMRRWLANADVQQSAALALRSLLEEDTASAADAISAGAPQLLRAALAAHPAVAELQRDGGRAAQLLVSQTDDVVADTPPREEPAGQANPRKGLASALLERRAAEQSKPSMVSAAVGWLFSNVRVNAARGPRQGASEPPGGRAPAPAPCMPIPPGVPRLDLRSVLQHDPEAARHPPEAAGVAITGPGGARRASSRPAARPTGSAAHEPAASSSPRDDSPHTPPAVRLQRREEALNAMAGVVADTPGRQR